MADFEDTSAGYDGTSNNQSKQLNADDEIEGRSYERRDRSASPRGDRERDDREDRVRDRSPNGRGA